jgi:methionine-rich copper-binding protein CopC
MGHGSPEDTAMTGVVISLIYILCLFPVVSWAHAFPDHSDPEVGATVDSSPEIIRIWFDSELEPASSKIEVRNSDDKRVDKNDGRVDADDLRLLEVSVPTLLSGRYRVIWSAGAKDGHHSNGDFTFRVK